MGNASHAASDTSDEQGGRVSEPENSEIGSTASRRSGGEKLEMATLLTSGSKLQKRYQGGIH
jgi:hypothetical protein